MNFQNGSQSPVRACSRSQVLRTWRSEAKFLSQSAKPELVIHLSRLLAEGQTFSSQLLKLATIFR